MRSDTARARGPGARWRERTARRWQQRSTFHYRRSLASRVALLTTVAVGACLALMALLAFVTLRVQLQSSLDSSLLDRAHKAAQYTVMSELTRQDYPAWMLGAADVRIALVTAEGQAITDREEPEIQLGSSEVYVARSGDHEVVRTVVASDGSRYRIAAVPGASGQALVLAQPLAAQDRTLARLGTLLLVAGGLGVLAAALAGWGVARNGLRPVRRLTTSVEQIARTEDLRPLQVEGDDEIARLASAFNQMLAALAASRDRQRQLVADAGHELRTPLTSLRTNLDLLGQADADDGAMGLPPEARAELLEDVRAQIEELTTLVGDLVELARDEPAAATIEDVELAEVVERALARVRRRAPGLVWATDLGPGVVRGDSTALERAITNLLDNAAKWSPPGGVVGVDLRDGVLAVTDEGPGIAAEDLPRVFDRFYRSDESRAMPGSGLGLAIVRQVVERHSGTVTAESEPDRGSRFVVRLPVLQRAGSVSAQP